MEQCGLVLIGEAILYKKVYGCMAQITDETEIILYVYGDILIYNNIFLIY